MKNLRNDVCDYLATLKQENMYNFADDLAQCLVCVLLKMNSLDKDVTLNDLAKETLTDSHKLIENNLKLLVDMYITAKQKSK
jgi:hypothetical protein